MDRMVSSGGPDVGAARETALIALWRIAYYLPYMHSVRSPCSLSRLSRNLEMGVIANCQVRHGEAIN